MRRAHAGVRRPARRRAKAKEAIAKSLAQSRRRAASRQADADAALARIEIVDALAALKPCHVVVEAIVEELGAKQELFSGAGEAS